MDRHHAVAGVGGVVRFGDRDYCLRPLTLGDLAEIKALVVSRQTSPLEALGRELDRIDRQHHPAMMRAALREACELRAARADEINAHLQSFEGTAHLFWIMARDDCPALDSLAAAKSALAEFNNGRLLELQGRLDQATGFLSDTANLGNSSGQVQSEATRAATAIARQSATTGAASIAN
jgi:HAMP domain-containing protein